MIATGIGMFGIVMPAMLTIEFFIYNDKTFHVWR